jgi:hypothetical protein
VKKSRPSPLAFHRWKKQMESQFKDFEPVTASAMAEFMEETRAMFAEIRAEMKKDRLRVVKKIE